MRFGLAFPNISPLVLLSRWAMFPREGLLAVNEVLDAYRDGEKVVKIHIHP